MNRPISGRLPAKADHYAHGDPETGCGLMMLGAAGAALVGIVLLVWWVLHG